MHMRLNKQSQVFRYWQDCRRGSQMQAQLNQTVIVILAYLAAHGESYQIIIANETKLNQGNLSFRHLPNLDRMGMITYRLVERLHLRRPNQPSRIYRITNRGRRLLELLHAYDNGITLGLVLDTSPYFADDASRTRLTSNLSQVG